MTELENKILKALREHKEWLISYDKDCQAEYDKYMELANKQSDLYWKKEYTHKAEWAIGFLKHEYDFIEAWKNVISDAMYGRVFQEWHSAQAGRHGTGHGAYITTELTDEEKAKVHKVFKGLVNQGYLRVSKSGYQATLKK